MNNTKDKHNTVILISHDNVNSKTSKYCENGLILNIDSISTDTLDGYSIASTVEMESGPSGLRRKIDYSPERELLKTYYSGAYKGEIIRRYIPRALSEISDVLDMMTDSNDDLSHISDDSVFERINSESVLFFGSNAAFISDNKSLGSKMSVFDFFQRIKAFAMNFLFNLRMILHLK